MTGVLVVTDSTASLPPAIADAAGVIVVPLQVIVDGRSMPESFVPSVGSITPQAVAAALRAGQAVSTSRPAPEAFASAYATAVERGATAIVSVHLSGGISGTCDAARLAARAATVPVAVVDSRTVAGGCGFAALAAAAAAAEGATMDEVAEVARRHAETSVTYFCVEDLEFLRRGGRIGTAQALVGSALAVKPILTMADGKITPRERVRTMSRALGRMADLAGEALGAAADEADVSVFHLDNPQAADRLAGTLAERWPAIAERVLLWDLSSALGVHCGPGAVGVVVSPRG